MKRLENLEEISSSFEGVEQAFAVQAGREVRIMVKPDVISDDQVILLARSIAKKIETRWITPARSRSTSSARAVPSSTQNKISKDSKSRCAYARRLFWHIGSIAKWRNLWYSVDVGHPTPLPLCLLLPVCRWKPSSCFRPFPALLIWLVLPPTSSALPPLPPLWLPPKASWTRLCTMARSKHLLPRQSEHFSKCF